MSQNKKDPGVDRTSLVEALEQAVETLRQNTERIQTLEKMHAESEWYLGEAKARNQQLEDELRNKEQYIRAMEDERRELARRYEEAEWYLGEKNRRLEQMENAVRGMEARSQDLSAQMESLRTERPGA